MLIMIILLQWVAPETNGKSEHEDKIAIDLDDEYGDALNGASQEEIIDLAGTYKLIFFNVCIIKFKCYIQIKSENIKIIENKAIIKNIFFSI